MLGKTLNMYLVGFVYMVGRDRHGSPQKIFLSLLSSPYLNTRGNPKPS